MFLAIHYLPRTEGAFDSVVHIMRDVNGGAVIRSVHRNGAAFFFFFLYLHMGRGLYYGSFRFAGVWLTGIGLFLALLLVAFLGYVLV